MAQEKQPRKPIAARIVAGQARESGTGQRTELVIGAGGASGYLQRKGMGMLGQVRLGW